MKPSIGRIVTVKGVESNGADEHPAIVTRVWSTVDPAGDRCSLINVTVFRDGGDPLPLSSVPLYESALHALQHRDEQRRAMRLIQERAGDRTLSVNGPIVAFWPERA